MANRFSILNPQVPDTKETESFEIKGEAKYYFSHMIVIDDNGGRLTPEGKEKLSAMSLSDLILYLNSTNDIHIVNAITRINGVQVSESNEYLAFSLLIRGLGIFISERFKEFSALPVITPPIVHRELEENNQDGHSLIFRGGPNRII